MLPESLGDLDVLSKETGCRQVVWFKQCSGQSYKIKSSTNDPRWQKEQNQHIPSKKTLVPGFQVFAACLFPSQLLKLLLGLLEAHVSYHDQVCPGIRTKQEGSMGPKGPPAQAEAGCTFLENFLNKSWQRTLKTKLTKVCRGGCLLHCPSSLASCFPSDFSFNTFPRWHS